MPSLQVQEPPLSFDSTPPQNHLHNHHSTQYPPLYLTTNPYHLIELKVGPKKLAMKRVMAQVAEHLVEHLVEHRIWVRMW